VISPTPPLFGTFSGGLLFASRIGRACGLQVGVHRQHHHFIERKPERRSYTRVTSFSIIGELAHKKSALVEPPDADILK
jgi:hypothetical protein